MTHARRTSSTWRMRACSSLLVAFLASTVCTGGEAYRADLWGGVADGYVATDPNAAEGKCVVADLSRETGDAVIARANDLPKGEYEVTVRLKVSRVNHINTSSVVWTVAVENSGVGKKVFDIQTMRRAKTYQEIPLRCVVDRDGPVDVVVSWERGREMRADLDDIEVPEETLDMGERFDDGPLEDLDEDVIDAELADDPPLRTVRHLYMAVDEVRLRRLGDAAFRSLSVDKICYLPGERALVSYRLQNLAPTERTLSVETSFVRDIEAAAPVETRDLTLAPGGQAAVTFRAPPFEEQWGYAVRCRASDGGRPVAEREEYFTVHENMWAVCIPGSLPTQYTGNVESREQARDAMVDNKRRYRNFVESGFWAPDDFGDFTPETEHWWGGQNCYYGGKTGTKLSIEEGHMLGIRFAVYSNIWGGCGPPAFELARKHPFRVSPSGVNVKWLEIWDENPRGRGEGFGLKVWPIVTVNRERALKTGNMGVYDHHASELVGTHRMFGWDAVRYDSHNINPDLAEPVAYVKKQVAKEEPDFQFGYNSVRPARDEATQHSLAVHCEGGNLVMEESIRKHVPDYKRFAQLILNYSAEVRRFGGHFLAIGRDEFRPNDLLYQWIFWLAGNTHPCYDWGDPPVAPFAAFATRYAELLWSHDMKRLPKAKAIIDLGDAGKKLWMWERYVQHRDMGGGRRRLVLHLINHPVPKLLFADDDNALPAPLADLPVSVRLPDGATVASVRLLTPDHGIRLDHLESDMTDGALSFVVPDLRFWDIIIIDVENAEQPFTGADGEGN